MNGIRDQLFARARFTQDEHRCLGGRHQGQRLEDLQHLRAVANDSGKIELGFQPLLP